MESNIIISEIFESCQGEGQYAGTPMLFIRTSGCTRSCDFCDSKYHVRGKEYSIKELIKIIKKSKLRYVCWTGGEPLLQRDKIIEIIGRTEKINHLETNGDLLDGIDFNFFDYIACSPKDKKIAKEIKKIVEFERDCVLDIKIVTDLKTIGKDLIKYATILMPLSTYTSRDKKIQKKVWQYCIQKDIKFCGRLQYFIFGKKKSV